MAGIVATGSLSDLGYIEEVAYGIIPDVPQFTVFRRKSAAGLNLTKDSYDSEEIRSDRMVSDSRHGTRRSGGDVETEVSSPAYLDHLAALMGTNAEAAPPTNGSVAGVTVVLLSTDGYRASFTGFIGAANDGYSVGMRVSLLGFSGANNGFFTIVGIVGDVLHLVKDKTATSTPFVAEVTPAATSFLLVPVGNLIRIGSSYRSFTFERVFADIQKYQTYTGIRINSLAVALPPTGLASFTWNLVGKDASALSNSSADIDAGAAVTRTQVHWGVLTFDGAHKITRVGGTSDFVADLTVGDTLVFDTITETSGNNVSEMAGKLYTIQTITSATIIIVKEKVADDTATSATFSSTVTGSHNYTAASSNAVMAAVSGALYLGEGLVVDQLAVVTDMNFTVDNQISGSEVVGQNTVPFNLFGVNQSVTGTMTVLFENEALYNLFEQEKEATIIMRLDAPGGTNSIGFTFPRCKFNSGSIGDAVSEGLPVEMEFRSLRPTSTNLGTFTSATPLFIHAVN